jgi:hypothetical protein
MQDRPTIDELLRGLELLLDEQFIPQLEGAHRYNSRVASNAVKIIRRELASEERQIDAEWRGLDGLLGPAERPRALSATKQALRDRNAELVERIRAGDADGGEFGQRVRPHVREMVRAKLEVNDPGWLAGEAGR